MTPVPVPTSVAGVEGSYKGHCWMHMDRRHLYYAAETVRRGIRDHCTEKETDQFEVLKNEVYDGVVETWEDSYKNGLARMSKVMQQASLLPLSGSRICRETTWVGSAQRKGVCHFLVGEGRLEGWVQEDDGEAIQ